MTVETAEKGLKQCQEVMKKWQALGVDNESVRGFVHLAWWEEQLSTAKRREEVRAREQKLKAKERVEIRETKPENVIISVDKVGAIYLYESKMPNVDTLVEKLKTKSKLRPQPEIQIRGDMDGNYEGVGKILLACQRAGISKVAFITEPPARSL